MIEKSIPLDTTNLDNCDEEPFFVFFVHRSTDWSDGPAQLREEHETRLG